VVVPLLVSAIQTSWRHPLAIFEFPVWQNYRTNPAGRLEMARIRLLVFFGYVFVPSILIVNKEKAKLKQKIIEEQGKEEFDSEDGIVTNKTLEEQEQLEVYLDEVRKGYLIFKRNEAALELVVQQSVQLTMLLLSSTNYPVTAGLEDVFGEDNSNYLNLNLNPNALLVMSVCWSLKTGVVSFLKIHSEQKAGMLSGAAKVVLGLRALLFSVTRIVCVVAFFGPFLGLGDCMAHWHAEGIRLDPELLDNLLENLNSSSSYWDNQTVSLMYREQDYTNYTLVTLQAAFFIFLGVIFLHGIAIFILKMNVSTHFKSTGWLNKVGHVVESLHVPDVYKDFDVDLNPDWDRTPYDYRMSFDSVLKETMWMSSLQAVSNLLLLVPLLVTASKVRERHSVLVLNIGTFAEEDEAYELLNNLIVSLPLVVLVTWIFDALLAIVYLKWLHPWKILLQEEPEQWGPEMFDDEEGVEQADEQMEDNQARDVGASGSAHEQEDSPLSVRSGVDVELHSYTRSNQGDAEIEMAEGSKKEQDSKEAETEV